MARIFRQRWTYTVDGQKVTRLTTKWYIEYRPAGVTKAVRVPGFKDKKLTQQLAAKLERVQ